MGSAEKLHHLKLIVGAVDTTVRRDSFAAPDLASGVPKGTVVEITGPRKYEWYIAFLKQNPELRCFWAERQPQVVPVEDQVPHPDGDEEDARDDIDRAMVAGDEADDLLLSRPGQQ